MTTEIDDYVAALPSAQREVLQRFRERLHAAIPSVEDAIKTRVRALRYNGKTVVGFFAAARHLALYVLFGDALRALQPDLARLEATPRVVRFTHAAPLPAALVRKIVRFRLAEVDERSQDEQQGLPSTCRLAMNTAGSACLSPHLRERSADSRSQL